MAGTSKTRKLQGHDSFHRLNYLYQMSKYVAQNSVKLSSYYGNTLVNIAKKNVQKIHPDIKRQICKKCRTILVEGKTVDTKIEIVSKKKCLIMTCKYCQKKKKLLVPKNYKKIWLEESEAVVEVLEYS